MIFRAAINLILIWNYIAQQTSEFKQRFVGFFGRQRRRHCYLKAKDGSHKLAQQVINTN